MRPAFTNDHHHRGDRELWIARGAKPVNTPRKRLRVITFITSRMRPPATFWRLAHDLHPVDEEPERAHGYQNWMTRIVGEVERPAKVRESGHHHVSALLLTLR